MILKDKISNLEISNNVIPSSFKIQTSRKAFDILSRQLYTNSIQAIIREISTNAYDSHVAAKKPDKPFTVHLPNSFEPYFAVRDDGIGLSDEDINTIYTTYFDSNKNKSNEFTGCLGLGSKSPFSYTEQFTIETRYNGIKTLYAAFINENGVPSITKMDNGNKTKEENGVEIRFSVAKEDFSKFRNEAEHVLRWFSTLPIITGQKIIFPTNTYILSTTSTYDLYKNSIGFSYIIMGNVGYPLSTHNLSYDIQNKFSNQEKIILQYGCNLYLPIGSVDIAANRESVNYDDNTIATIKKYLAIIIADSKKYIEDSIKNVKTSFDARLALSKYKNGILSTIHSGHKFMWQGKEIEARLTFPSQISAYSISYSSYSKTKWRTYKEISTNIDTDIFFFENDVKGGLERIFHHCDNKGLHFDAYNKKGFYFSDSPDNEKFFKEEGLEGHVIKASTLPIPPKAAIISKAKEFSKIYKFDDQKVGGANRDYWKIEENLEDNALYVEIFRFFVKDKWYKENEAGLRPNQIRQLLEKLVKIKKHKIIYGIRPNDVKAVKKIYPKWIELTDYITSLFTNTIKENLAIKKENYNLPQHYNNIHSLKFPVKNQFSDLQKLIKHGNKLHANQILTIYENIANQCNIQIEPSKSICTLISNIENKYPLIKSVTINHDNLNDIIQYMELVDKS